MPVLAMPLTGTPEADTPPREKPVRIMGWLLFLYQRIRDKNSFHHETDYPGIITLHVARLRKRSSKRFYSQNCPYNSSLFFAFTNLPASYFFVYLVYGTTRLVHTDDALLSVIRSEANAFLSGQKSAQDAASQTQSRMKLYLAENG